MAAKAWIYGRIAGESDSDLKMQIAHLRQYASDNGYDIAGITEEHFSSRVMDRPGLAEVEQAAQMKLMDVLLVHSTSRIARFRDVDEWINQIIDCGVEVRAVSEHLTFNEQNRPWNRVAAYYRAATEQQLM